MILLPHYSLRIVYCFRREVPKPAHGVINLQQNVASPVESSECGYLAMFIEPLAKNNNYDLMQKRQRKYFKGVLG
jgi:hypothetical protein